MYVDTGYGAERMPGQYRERAGTVVHRADGPVGSKWHTKMARRLPKHYGLK